MRRQMVFSPANVALALTAAVTLEAAFFLLLVFAGSSRASVKPAEDRARMEVPIAVKPILDDVPLLKLGGKKMRAKLPDMWKKNPPVQVFKESSAPSPTASETPKTLPTSPLAELDAQAPPPDAEVAKEVDQTLLDAGPDASNENAEEEGSAAGVKEGTETDPLKARAVSLYMMKILAWFNARFRQPEIPCELLKTLSASVAANVGPDRAVTGYSVVRPSGNADFDIKVRSTMDAITGQQLPPPPPLYPDILGQTVSPRFQGKCDKEAPAAPPSDKPESPEPAPPSNDLPSDDPSSDKPSLDSPPPSGNAPPAEEPLE
jgi:hypothetical protein